MSLRDESYTFWISHLDLGGAERVFCDLANQLSKECRIQLITQRTGQLDNRLSARVKHLPLQATTRRRALFRLWKHLKREKPRALLCTLWSPIVMGVVAGSLTGVPVIVRPASILPARRGLTGLFWRWVFCKATRVVALNQALAWQIAGFGVPLERIDVIANPLDLQAAETASARSPIEGPYLLTAARLSPEKDLKTMVRAFRLLLEPGYSGNLVILGDGPERESLEGLVEQLQLQQRVHLIGAQYPAWDWMRHCELYLSTSLREGMPNAVIEAMSLGKTVVATDCPGGQAELLGHGRWGYLAPPGQPEAFAGQMQRALQAPSDPAALRQHIRLHHSLERVSQQYLRSLRRSSLSEA